MIWGWFGNYYWLCYKRLGRETEDTPRTQFSPPNGTASVLPGAGAGGWGDGRGGGRQCRFREMTANGARASRRSRLCIHVSVHTTHTHTHTLTSHSPIERRGRTHFFQVLLKYETWQGCDHFCCTAKWPSRPYPHSHSVADSLPTSMATEHWVAFPVLYSRSLLAHHPIHLSVTLALFSCNSNNLNLGMSKGYFLKDSSSH